MKIENNKVVVLSYTARVDGMVVDNAPEGQPLDYIQGFHMLLPEFEAQLAGKEPGDGFAFEIGPEQAYGPYDPKSRFDIPKSSFEVKGVLREDLLVPGRMVPMLNGEGQVCHAQIIEVKDTAVTVDFNHPMAGKTLAFEGKVLAVRDATEKELREGLHGEFLPPEHPCHRHGKGGCHHGEGEGCCGGHGEDGECCGHGERPCRHHSDEEMA